jgi:Zn-dependent alcohol dehydrogenase
VEITPLVRREFTLRGSFGGIPESDLREVIDLAERGEIPLEKMVTQKYSLKEINRAFQSLNDKQTLGRSIIDFTSGKAL